MMKATASVFFLRAYLLSNLHHGKLFSVNDFLLHYCLYQRYKELTKEQKKEIQTKSMVLLTVRRSKT